MAALSEAPFLLKGTDKIFARSLLENDFGWSEPSDPISADMMGPSQIAKIRLVNADKLEWDSIPGQFSYELW